VSSEDVTTITPEFLAGERATLTDEEYAQEYLGQFSTPGMGLVDPEKLAALTRTVPTGVAPSVWDKMKGAGR
jgi:hypothetical protein